MNDNQNFALEARIAVLEAAVALLIAELANRPGGSVESLVELLAELVDLLPGAGAGRDPAFTAALADATRHLSNKAMTSVTNPLPPKASQ